MELMRGLLKRCTHSPPSPTTEVINQLEKGFSMAIHELAIKSKENHDLRLALERKKRKRQRLTKRLPNTGSLTMEEGREMVRALVEGGRAGGQDNPAEASQPRQRAPPTCSECHVVGHRRNQCPQRPR